MRLPRFLVGVNVSDYATAPLPVAPETAAAHEKTLRALAEPGAWWSGEDRLAIVREARAAADCGLCAEKSAVLSPNAATGEHAASESGSSLPPVALTAIHGIRNDSGRLTRRWFDDIIDMGMPREAYVELAAVVASSVVVDTYAQGIGLPLPALPEAVAGSPSFEKSEDVVEAGAWLPIARQGRANILRSLSLVPAASRLFFGAFGRSYYMRPDAEFRISRQQVELIASRVSAVNECFY